jgi:hypothetical protein
MKNESVKLWYTHVNRNTINSNTKHGKHDPPIRIQFGTYGQSIYCNSVELPSSSRMVYSPDVPILPCGARLVIISDQKPTILS